MRNEKVILDFHLAELYTVETRKLKQAVKRNQERFPKDFMFLLEEEELDFLVEQQVIPNKGVLGGAQPMAFTEQGVAMLSSVLRSKVAISVNIAVMRTFVHVRRILEEHKDLAEKILELENKYDERFQLVFEAIHELIEQKSTPRTPIGYVIGKAEEA